MKVFEDKLGTWLDQGAQPTDTVKSLLTQIGFTEKYLKAKRGEDVSGVGLKTQLKERPKKTRQMKKAAVAKAEAKEETAAAAETEKGEETPAQE